MTRKFFIGLVLFALLVVPITVTNAAESHDYHSHGEATFFGKYDYPSESENQNNTHNDRPGNNNGQSSNHSAIAGNEQSPNYSASGHQVIPPMGDQRYVMIQIIGTPVIFTVFSILLINKRIEGDRKS